MNISIAVKAKPRKRTFPAGGFFQYVTAIQKSLFRLIR